LSEGGEEQTDCDEVQSGRRDSDTGSKETCDKSKVKQDHDSESCDESYFKRDHDLESCDESYIDLSGENLEVEQALESECLPYSTVSNAPAIRQ
jgi:hypothetical protein